MYKIMVKPVAVYGSETQHMTEMGMKRLNTWEMEILRTIYGPVVEQGIWTIRTNQELQVLCKDLDIVDIENTGTDRISSQNGLWQGSQKIFENKLEGGEKR